MKKYLFLSLVVFLSFAIVTGIFGCSTGPSFPEDATTETDEPEDVYGQWSGTWSSYEGSTGLIDSLSIEQKKEDSETVYFTGTIELTGMQGISQGQIDGTQQDDEVVFTATFGESTSIDYEGVRVGDSMQGTYIRYDNEEQTDSGNWLVNKED